MRDSFLGVLLVALITVSGQATNFVTISYDLIEDERATGDRHFEQKNVRVDYKQVYVTGFFGDWQEGAEFGGYLKDKRRSVYSSSYRVRDNDQQFRVATAVNPLSMREVGSRLVSNRVSSSIIRT